MWTIIFQKINYFYSQIYDPKGRYSEKRWTRTKIVDIMLLLTIAHCYHIRKLEMDMLIVWLTAAGISEFRMFQDKKIDKLNDNGGSNDNQSKDN
jgi:hypothetical protein